MNKFNNRGNFGERRQFGRRDSGDFERGERRMFRATCADCGRDCEVPFKPTGEKPIYCSNCYERQQGGGGERKFQRFEDRRPRWDNQAGNSFSQRPNRENSNWQQLAAIESKLDKILKILSPEPKPEGELENLKPAIKKTKKIKKETLLG